MSSHPHLRVALLCLAILTVTTAVQAEVTAQTWSDVTVVDVHGWRLEGVSISWVEDGTALQIRRVDGATKTITPDEIQHIYDAQGTEITADVGLARAGTATATGRADEKLNSDLAEIRSDPGAVLESAREPRLYSVAFDLGVGYGTTTGSWFAGLDDGVNYHAGVRFTVDQNNYIHLLFRSQDFGTQYLEFFGDPEPVIIRLETTLREYQFLMGRYGALVKNNNLQSIGYLEYGLSVMEHRFVAGDLIGGDESITKTGLVLRGGVLIFLDKNVAFDFSADVTWKTDLANDEAAGLLMGAHLGLTVMF
jgi:hypothetical protein